MKDDAVYYEALLLNFKDIPINLLKAIAKNKYYSYRFALRLKFQNIPEIILQSIIDNNLWFDKLDNNFKLLFIISSFDKRVKSDKK